MKEIHDATFVFKPTSCVDALKAILDTQCPVLHSDKTNSNSNHTLITKNTKTDGAYA